MEKKVLFIIAIMMAIIFISCEKEDEYKESEKEIKTELDISTPDTFVIDKNGYGIFFNLVFHNNELSKNNYAVDYYYEGNETYGFISNPVLDFNGDVKCSLFLVHNKEWVYIKRINVEKGQKKTVKITKEEYAVWINDLIK